MATQLFATYALISDLAKDLKVAQEEIAYDPGFDIADDLLTNHLMLLKGVKIKERVDALSEEWNTARPAQHRGLTRSEYIAVRLIEELPAETLEAAAARI